MSFWVHHGLIYVSKAMGFIRRMSTRFLYGIDNSRDCAFHIGAEYIVDIINKKLEFAF